MVLRRLTFLLALVSITSCKDAFPKSAYDNAIYVNRTVMGKKIVFESNLLKINEVEIFEKKAKTILIISSIECNSCVSGLKDIQQFILQNDLIKKKANVVYVGLGENVEYIKVQSEKNNFQFPIRVDSSGKFMEDNDLDYFNRGVFLLDEDNKIIFVGSPLNNKDAAIIYTYLISGYPIT